MRSPVCLLTFFLISVFIFACSDKSEDVKSLVRNFIAALAEHDEGSSVENSGLTSFYPDVHLLGIPSGPSEAGAMEVKKVKGIYEVEMANGKAGNPPILFKVGMDKEKNLVIIDSKGLIGNALIEWKPFAIRTGCLPKDADFSDKETSKAIAQAKTIYENVLKSETELMSKQLELLKWDWDQGTSSGTMKVKNNTGMEIQGIDYQLDLLGEGQKVIQTFEKTITNDLIEEGESFEGQINLDEQVKNTGAKIRVFVNSKFLKRVVLYKEYSGNECNKN